jgi:hypothetical protein
MSWDVRQKKSLQNGKKYCRFYFVYSTSSCYTLTIKGSTVIAIDPQGTYCPLYQRAHYRENRVRWRRVNRFVSDERIGW